MYILIFLYIWNNVSGVCIFFFVFLHLGCFFPFFYTSRILNIIGSSISGCNISRFSQDLDVLFSLFTFHRFYILQKNKVVYSFVRISSPPTWP
jgi:hypothetical protein